MKNFRDYLGLSNSCLYDVIGRADRFGFQNFCSPAHMYYRAVMNSLFACSCSSYNVYTIFLVPNMANLFEIIISH